MIGTSWLSQGTWQPGIEMPCLPHEVPGSSSSTQRSVLSSSQITTTSHLQQQETILALAQVQGSLPLQTPVQGHRLYTILWTRPQFLNLGPTVDRTLELSWTATPPVAPGSAPVTHGTYIALSWVLVLKHTPTAQGILNIGVQWQHCSCLLHQPSGWSSFAHTEQKYEICLIRIEY